MSDPDYTKWSATQLVYQIQNLERRNAELEKELKESQLNGDSFFRQFKEQFERNAKLVELLKNCQNYILNFSRPLYVDGRSCEVDLCAEIARAVEAK